MSGEEGCVLIFVVLVIGLIAAAISGVVQGNKLLAERMAKLRAAEAEYRGALLKLQEEPTNATLKTETLRLGRVFSELAREAAKGDKSVTLFDEVALGNDISAATAGATGVSIPPVIDGDGGLLARLESGEEIQARLEKLSSLRSRDLISEEEYTVRRGKILDSI